ncbi:MAG: PEP-CTERM sorting domain-containing protein [Candidatus Accumulibacter sp.]|nr:PEP-CTERM sorting domain-containing protein [Accumulibacter sp.]
MKKSRTTTLYAVAAAGLLGFSVSASAGFSGDYAPGKWTLANLPSGDGSLSSQSSSSVTVTGSNDQNTSQNSTTTEFRIAATDDGTVSFRWSYDTSDSSPQYDPAGYLLENLTTHMHDYTQLTDSAGNLHQDDSGTPTPTSINVKKDQVFGFYVYTYDNDFGSATITITDFDFVKKKEEDPTPAPEPWTVALLALGLTGVAASRTRRRI